MGNAPRRGFSDTAVRLATLAREAAGTAIRAAFAAHRPVHEAGTGSDANSTYRVWSDGRRERVQPPAEATDSSRSGQTA